MTWRYSLRSTAALIGSLCLVCVPALGFHAELLPPAPPQAEGGLLPSAAWAENQTIRDIVLLSDGPIRRISRGDLEKLIGLKNGEAFSASRARAAIQQLHATGLFHDVQLAVEPVGGSGLDVKIVLVRKFVIRSVEFSGDLKLDARSLRPRSSLRVGDAFNRELVEPTTQELQAHYARDGYYKASIETRYEIDHSDASIKVIFQIAAGIQARIRSLEFDVEPEVDLEEIRPLMKIRVGGPYSEVQKDLDIAVIENHLKLRGYFNPQVYARGGVQYDESSNLVDLVLRIAPGRRTEVIFQGSTPPRQVLERSTLFSLGGTGDVYLDETLSQFRQHYQREGHFLATAEAQRFPETGWPQRLTFSINPGPEYTIGRIRFEGNREIPGNTLAKLLTVRKEGTFNRGRFTEQLAVEDCDRIEAVYQQSGHLDAEVDYRLTPDAGDSLELVFQIAEGEQYYVELVEIEGNRLFTQTELEQGLLAVPGKVFSPVMVAQDRATIVARYEDLGYRNVDFSSTFSVSSGHRVKLRYAIREGNQFFVDQVVVAGNKVTKDSVIRREIRVREGQPLSLGAVLETETNLYELAVFNRVQIVESASQQDPQRKTVVVNVEEAKQYTLLYGIGYSSFEGMRGTLGITDINYRGKARPLSFNVRMGRERQRGSISYALPRFLDGRLPTLLAFTADNQKAQTTRTGLASSAISGRPFDAFRLIASAQSERRLSRRESLFFRYEFEKVQTTVPEGLEAPLEFFREENVRLSSFSLSYLNESRSDPANPEDGFLLSGDAKLSSRFFGSQAELFRISAQGQYYHRLPKGVIWVASLRTGFALPYGKTAVVPISERYFSGGSTTIRGIPHDLAGPLLRCTGEDVGESEGPGCVPGEVILVDENGFPNPSGRPVPLGGEALALFNTEFRFPLVSLFRGAVFYDLGNVFEKISAIPRTRMFNAVGFGLHVRTPVGPLRFDIGFNPSPPDIAGFKHWNFFFTLGNPF